jgi:hypothetical protein
MHAVSLTPYAKYDHILHAMSVTPHANYDTVCTIDERFERPWKALKGISIKNLYVSELSNPNTTKI